MSPHSTELRASFRGPADRLAGRVGSLLIILATAVAGVAISMPEASATEVPGNPTLPAQSTSMWQTNAPVYSMAYANGQIWAGGPFTQLHPPGSAFCDTGPTACVSGSQSWQYLAVFSAATGAPMASGFSHTFGGVAAGLQPGPMAIAASPDGKTVYVGGNFTSVDGQFRKNLAAFSTTNGSLLSWAPSSSNYIRALAVSPATGNVYFSGPFTMFGGIPASRLAEVTGYNATPPGKVVTPFTGTASADSNVLALETSPDGTRLYVGGNFTALNGNPAYYTVGELDASTGGLNPFLSVAAMPRQDYRCSNAPCGPTNSKCCWSVIKDIVASGDTVYFGAEGTGSRLMDGTFAAHIGQGPGDPTPDGQLMWVNGCSGGTQAVAVVGGWLYKGSHAHDCLTLSGTTNSNGQRYVSDPDAFPEVPVGGRRHLLSQDPATGLLGPWYPNTNGAMGASLGPFAFATDGSSLWVGGEFTLVNGAAQQGVGSFNPGADATPPAASWPVAATASSGKVTVFTRPPFDPDDPDLTVDVYRDTSTLICTQTVHALFWRQPLVVCPDDGLAPGSTHTYTATVTEQYGTNSRSSTSPPVKVAATTLSYAGAVLADHPSIYWRLGEPTGSTAAADSSTIAVNPSASVTGAAYISPAPGSLVLARADAINGDPDTAVNFIGGYLTTTTPTASPSTFSIEVWIKTATATGGKIVGFGTNPWGDSATKTDSLYMTNAGTLVFGTNTGTTRTIQTTNAYNDNVWHHIVATQDVNGFALYVDGAVAPTSGNAAVPPGASVTGYWRVGRDSLSGWPSRPSSDQFRGNIDEVAVYPAALTLERVRAHYTASGRTAP